MYPSQFFHPSSLLFLFSLTGGPSFLTVLQSSFPHWSLILSHCQAPCLSKPFTCTAWIRDHFIQPLLTLCKFAKKEWLNLSQIWINFLPSECQWMYPCIASFIHTSQSVNNTPSHLPEGCIGDLCHWTMYVNFATCEWRSSIVAAISQEFLTLKNRDKCVGVTAVC